MLEAQMKSQLQAYLSKLQKPIQLIASLDKSDKSSELLALLEDIAGLSPLVVLTTSGEDLRRPSFVVARAGEEHGVRFAGIPLGHEFTSLVLALLWTGGHPPKVEQQHIEQARALDAELSFEVYMSLSCHN